MPDISILSHCFYLMQLRGTELNDIKKNLLPAKAKAKHAQKELAKIEKDIELTQRQLIGAQERKNEVSKCLVQLEKLRAEKVMSVTSFTQLRNLSSIKMPASTS